MLIWLVLVFRSIAPALKNEDDKGGLTHMLLYSAVSIPLAVFSLIPSGFYQFFYAVKYGLWYARSPEIASGPVIRALSWARMVPDIIFAVGAISLLLFLIQAIRISFFTKATPGAQP